jgi:molybdopterin-containing oxidoreductase family iron-sulfur binding subunit
MPSLEPTPTGSTYWRSLDELADTPQFRQFVEREFPSQGSALETGFSRRQFLQLMAASMLLGAGVTGCRRWPERQIAPFTARPDGQVPGADEYYATVMELDGVAKPLLVKTRDGRPIKIEGNPLHPASQGAADLLAQASVLGLYDPFRSRGVVRRDGGKLVPSSWADFQAFAKPHFAALRAKGGQGLAVVSEPTSSPTTLALAKRWDQAFPRARWYFYSSLESDCDPFEALGSDQGVYRRILHLDKAKVIACFDADLLMKHPDAVRHTRDFVQGRKSVDSSGQMSRLYVAEGTLSVTGTMADQRLAVRSGDIPTMLRALADRVLAGRAPGTGTLPPEAEVFVCHLADDLLAHRGASLVAAGSDRPDVQDLVHTLNQHLGNYSQTLGLIALTMESSGADALADLGREAASISTLVILSGNPLFDAPGDCDVATALAKIPTTIHLSPYVNETSQACAWHVNQAHYLEAWGDARAWDGTASVAQPLILPLFDGKTPAELLATLLDQPQTDGYSLVRQTWAQMLPKDNFEKSWRRVLHDGLLPGSAAPEVVGVGVATAHARKSVPAGPFELVFLQDHKLYDGRFADSGWLQELPDPITKIVWDNAALMAPLDARDLGVEHGDLIEITAHGRSITAPVFLLPGQARGSIAISLGYGRTFAGPVGQGVGVNAYALRTTQDPWVVPGVTVRKTGGKSYLVTTQDHFAIDKVGMETRAERVKECVRELQLSDLAGSPAPEADKTVHLQLWNDPVQYKQDPTVEYMWGMAIDLNSCTGCNACVLACQAENNIPIVGKEQAGKGREMHWVRIDRYFRGDASGPAVQAVHQPVACVQCETAPCEQVCPFAATTHSREGLNMQVYNRCVGTRYCANNCPYKVRRFNFFDWHAHDPRRTAPTPPWLNFPDTQSQVVDQILRMVFNPDVTVRMRGVMEKCTYCVQRIEAARSLAGNQGRRIRDGEITPACAQTCPAEAIVFGNIKDPASKVRKLQDSQRSYGLLAELNTRPRTQYLARVRNSPDDDSAASAPAVP